MPTHEEWKGSYTYNGPYVGFTPMDSGGIFVQFNPLFVWGFALSLSLSLILFNEFLQLGKSIFKKWKTHQKMIYKDFWAFFGNKK